MGPELVFDVKQDKIGAFQIIISLLGAYRPIVLQLRQPKNKNPKI